MPNSSSIPSITDVDLDQVRGGAASRSNVGRSVVGGSLAGLNPALLGGGLVNPLGLGLGVNPAVAALHRDDSSKEMAMCMACVAASGGFGGKKGPTVISTGGPGAAYYG